MKPAVNCNACGRFKKPKESCKHCVVVTDKDIGNVAVEYKGTRIYTMRPCLGYCFKDWWTHQGRRVCPSCTARQGSESSRSVQPLRISKYL